jgi:hypothetical protein
LPEPAAASAPREVGPVAQSRCPRCAYPLTGLPGTPAVAYGEFTQDARCPECALVIPRGARCITGGSSPSVVGAEGLRTVTWIGIGALVCFGPHLLGVVVAAVGAGTAGGSAGFGVRALLRALVPNFGSTLGVLGMILGAGVGAWFLWRRWRPTDQAGPGEVGERAGGRMRRVLVVPGGLHFWFGEPAAGAEPRSLAGLDVRQMRGRRYVPLFRRKGAAEVGAIDFITPIVLWSLNDAKSPWNITDSRPAGTIWVLLPPGAHADGVARDIERTLRAPPSEPVAAIPLPKPGPDHLFAASLARHPSGDPNRLLVPPAVTAATVGVPPQCPACCARISADDGPWWEPLASEVSCGRCGLRVPAGAMVVTGWRTPLEAQRSPILGWRVAVVVLVAVVLLVFGVASMVAFRSVIPFLLTILVFGLLLPLGILWAIRRGVRQVPRPRTRFQPGTQAWIAEPGRLRILTPSETARFRGAGPQEVTIPANQAASIRFVPHFMQDQAINSLQTDRLVLRSTSPALGNLGEIGLEVAVPAEVDHAQVAERLKAALNAPAG